MSDEEGFITIEIRGPEKAALEASRRISDLFLSSGPCRLRRTPGEQDVQVLVYADVHRDPREGGYLDPGTTQVSTPEWDPGYSPVSGTVFASEDEPTMTG
ncbi:hypothetical protein [Streptomyces sp. NBC_01244]|uniref:hypothetical protein n=1 Tax=Streptomyces sp. NBC_01244 TaxID=2903797 RepID=UPI002E0ED13A|nr:hypothetical protein OG247_42330 [Streptomyces sp. NBC_01244]